MTDKETILLKMRDAAAAAGHIFPEYAACEGALESAWFTSRLFLEACNIFGQKAPSRPAPNQHTITMDTREVVNGQDQNVSAAWLKFASPSDCFAARMALLKRLSIYSPAIRAASGLDFIMNVSAVWKIIPSSVMTDEQQVAQFPSQTLYPVITVDKTHYQFLSSRWSTDPHRGPSVMEIYNAHKEIFQPAAA